MADTINIYRRRPKCATALDDDKENEKELSAPLTTVENHIAKNSRARKSQPNWIDRSLSSRSNINKVKADSFASRRANDKAKQIMSPNLHRKKRVEAPANFVHEQRSHFEQVDAFELEEESPPAKDHWISKHQQENTSAPCLQFCKKGLLQAVQEDIPEDLPYDVLRNLSSEKDPLSHILETPQPLGSIQNMVSQCQLQISEQGFRENTGVTSGVSFKAHETPLTRKVTLHTQTEMKPGSNELTQKCLPGKVQVELDRKPVCKVPVTPMELNAIVILSSDDENTDPVESLKSNPSAKSKHNTLQRQRHEASRARQSGPHAIILDDSPVPFNKGCNTHSSVKPVKCEYHSFFSTSKKVPIDKVKADVSASQLAAGSLLELRTGVQFNQLHCKADEGLTQDIEKLDSQADKESPKNLEALLQKCGQTVPLLLEEAISQFSDVGDVQKLGEGTYGEAFKASNFVFKIVPMGGDFLVNGEIQKNFAEMYTEMLLTLTLNRLRRQSIIQLDSQRNVCNNFIETKMVKVCQGVYGQTLINAWEEWDIIHKSENDNPKVFPENQVYMLFVLADGGKDLESFSIISFDVARSILTQVTAALAIAEEDCEFEHRDLHWGNILVAQTNLSELHCTLNGTDMQINTCGVFVHIIDFTLSRLSTGKEILFSNLSDDPLLFKGPKGDIQAETYRKMLHLTNGSWDKRFSKTNCYWIHYLVDILLTKKKYACLPQESRALRALKKRVLCYESARDCLQDKFFQLK